MMTSDVFVSHGPEKGHFLDCPHVHGVCRMPYRVRVEGWPDDMALDRAGCREKSQVVMLVFSHVLEGSVPCVWGQREVLHNKRRGPAVEMDRQRRTPQVRGPKADRMSEQGGGYRRAAWAELWGTQGSLCIPSLVPFSSELPQVAFQGDQYTFVGGKSAYWKRLAGLINMAFKFPI